MDEERLGIKAAQLGEQFRASQRARQRAPPGLPGHRVVRLRVLEGELMGLDEPYLRAREEALDQFCHGQRPGDDIIVAEQQQLGVVLLEEAVLPFGMAEVLPEPLVGETGATVGQSGAERVLGPLGETGLLGAVAEGDDHVAHQLGSARVVKRLGERLGVPEQRRRRERMRDCLYAQAGPRCLGLRHGTPIS